VQALAVKYAADADAFAAAVAEFYTAHAALVSETLTLTIEQANDYCSQQAAQVVSDWLAAVALWKSDEYAAGLAALALEEAA
jgi:L-rhamnose isomerase